MKTSIVSIIIISTIIFSGCSIDKPQPTNPNNTIQGNGKGKLYGITSLWKLVGGSNALYWNDQQKGVRVEILGTNKFTETDGYGLYTLFDVDSGYHSLVFSKKGFETTQIDSIFCNGKDSTKVYFVLKDSLGRTGVPAEIIDIRELTPAITVSKALAEAKETIRIDTIRDHGTIREIRRDTSYSLQGEFSIDLKSDVKATQDSIDVGFYVAISNSNTIDKSKLPTEFSDSQSEIKKGWVAYWGSSIKTKPVYTGTRDFGINSTGKDADQSVSLHGFTSLFGYTVSKNQQLYLHIIPVTKELVAVQKSNRLSTWKEARVTYKLGDLKTIPIEWK